MGGMTRHRQIWSWLAVALAGALAACNAVTVVVGDGAPAPLRIDNATLADDRLSVRVDFVGGPEFDLDDPCSNAYEWSAEIVGEELQIGVFPIPHPEPVPEGVGCELMGHPRTLTLRLEEPFTGSTIRDLTGQVVVFMEPPKRLAQIGPLPPGWELRREGDLVGSATRTWERVWSPDADPWEAEGDPMLTLYQAFGGPLGGDPPGGEVQPGVAVNDRHATLYLHRPTGAMTLIWSLGADELELDGYRADFTKAEFIEVAESIVLPDQ
jgi:hypothetical protein